MSNALSLLRRAGLNPFGQGLDLISQHLSKMGLTGCLSLVDQAGCCIAWRQSWPIFAALQNCLVLTQIKPGLSLRPAVTKYATSIKQGPECPVIRAWCAIQQVRAGVKQDLQLPRQIRL